MTDDATSPTTMDQRIFRMGLSVEAISIYLLACALTDAGETATQTSIGLRWNGSAEELADGISLLVDRKVFTAMVDTDSDREPAFVIAAPDAWTSETADGY